MKTNNPNTPHTHSNAYYRVKLHDEGCLQWVYVCMCGRARAHVNKKRVSQEPKYNGWHFVRGYEIGN